MAARQPSLMPDFLHTLRKFCRSKHGRVGELADYLGVAQPHVSAWLTGKQEPSGENTLQVQAWLAGLSSKEPSRRRTGATRVMPRHPEAASASEPADAAADELPVWLL